MDDAEGYLLSTRDLCAIDYLDALRAAGVDSFKIEGRLKRAEYVAVVTAAYRDAIDHPNDHHDLTNLKQIFNRGGFTAGYLPGLRDTELMYAERPNHLGIAVGICRKNGWVTLDTAVSVKDALVLRADDSDRPVQLSGEGTLSCPDARRGDRLIRLVSEDQMRAAQDSVRTEHRAVPLSAALTLRIGAPAHLHLSDGIHSVDVSGDIISPARTRGLDPARVEDQLRKTGGTPYAMERIEIDADDDAFCAVSALNALRRDALDAMTRARCPASVPLCPLPPAKTADRISSSNAPRIAVQSGNIDILTRAHSADNIIFAPTDVRGRTLSDIQDRLPERFGLAVPMVLGQDSLKCLNDWALAQGDRIDSVYLSNIAHLGLTWPGTPVADFGLNIANRYALDQLSQWGIHRYTPSVELNSHQIAALGKPNEIIVHGRLPLMHLRHCPYRAVHGIKGLHADCRRCDHCAQDDHIDAKSLIDRTGASFPLMRIATDQGCIVEVLNSVPMMLLKRSARLPSAEAWRILIDEPEQTQDLIRLYKMAANHLDPRSDPAWSKFENMATTTGHFFRGAE